MDAIALWQLYRASARRLLSEQDRDPYSPTLGCFDRRFWGWKLVDYAEATYQRNVYPLAWWLQHDNDLMPAFQRVLSQAVINGIKYSIKIQNRDGSFDQAFPHEHSFGATAFILGPLLKAYLVVQHRCASAVQESIVHGLFSAAKFLCRHDETHGFITNHLAGAALSLLEAADFFQEPRFENRANELLDRILGKQSPEGWFLEYEGADPGYQTLCLYYLAQVYRLRPTESLHRALGRAVEFLAWFIHPDGTFGGEYGSRRTAIFYPGGLALLSKEFALASSMTRFMVTSALEGRTPNPLGVDIGNLAPLLSNYALLIESGIQDEYNGTLPFQEENAFCDFPEAGLYVRGTSRYYAILGASNGGVLKVFDKQKHLPLWNDAGYVGLIGSRTLITTQMTDLKRPCEASPQEVVLETPFYQMLRSQPAPMQFLILRLLNLTVMRSIFLGNLVKGVLVYILMRRKREVPLVLRRKVLFQQEQVIVQDTIRLCRAIALRWLEFGRPFVSIHMASAHYFEGPETDASAFETYPISVVSLLSEGVVEHQVTI